MAGSYELTRNDKGQYRFTLKAGNGETILHSEAYESRAAAENGIASVQKNCGSDDRYELKDAADGRFYFNLKAANHQVIGTSQMYTTTQSRAGGIASVKTNGPATSVSDKTG
ncbi:MAG: YegP family protein [Gemmatimonadales bacterium]